MTQWIRFGRKSLLFLARKAWQIPLLIGVLAVLSLLAFTFLQPPIWIRALVDAVLLGGLVFFVLTNGVTPLGEMS